MSNVDFVFNYYEAAFCSRTERTFLLGNTITEDSYRFRHAVQSLGPHSTTHDNKVN